MTTFQEQIAVINKQASENSIMIIINPDARPHEVKSVVVDSEHPMWKDSAEDDLALVSNPTKDSWGKAVYGFRSDIISRIYTEMQVDPRKRSFKGYEVK